MMMSVILDMDSSQFGFAIGTTPLVVAVGRPEPDAGMELA